MKSNTKKLSPSPAFYKILIIFLLGVVIYLTTVIFQFSSQLSTTDKNALYSSSATEDVPTGELKMLSSNITQFTHPTLGYTVDFPSDWAPKLFKSLAGNAVQPYKDLIIYSPDYKENETTEALSDTSQGASILVRVSETHYPTIEEKFKENITAHKIARNVTRTTINSLTAIQYDYSIDGENATNITMVENGYWYLIKYQYANEETKNRYKNIFDEVKNTFKFKNN